MVTGDKKRKSTGSKTRFIGKLTGKIQERVQAVGPEHFGIVAVDCAKRRSKWMLCDFYEVYQSLQAVSRHRHNLVKQRARLMVQIRRLLHQTMPVALQFSSAEVIQQTGLNGIAKHLKETKVAENLIKCHPYYRGLSELWKQGVTGDPLIRQPVSTAYSW